MDIKELVAGFKEKGMSDEEITTTLKGIRDEIDAILNPAKEEDVKIDNDIETKETEDDKMNRVFGL